MRNHKNRPAQRIQDLNRLTEAYYADVQVAENNRSWNRPNVTFSRDNAYKENVQYDVRGNITSLQRNGLKVNGFTGGNYVSGDFGQIDDLQYEYNDKNQVTRITDNAVNPNGPRGEKDLKGFVYKFDAANLNEHYKYDANGNLRYDAHKEIEKIEYNYLNLPAKITFTNDRVITFLYDATGRKLRKTVTGGGIQEQRDYLDGIEYKDGKPDQFLHSEGTVRRDENGVFHYYFVLRDHLGNTRVTFCDLNEDDKVSEKEEIIQINNYYAFGLNMEGNWNGKDGAHKYQYNEKEWNDDFGLGWNDYGARFYDPAIARWTTTDPLAELYFSGSPYNYVMNNPMNYTDPTGMAAEGTCNCGKSSAEHRQSFVELFGAMYQGSQSTQYGDDPQRRWARVGDYDPSKSSKGTPMISAGETRGSESDHSDDVQDTGDPTDPPKAYSNSTTFGFAFLGGLGMEYGTVYDGYGGSKKFFRFDGRLGLGVDMFSMQTTRILPVTGKTFTVNDWAGSDFSKSYLLGPLSWSFGGNTLTNGRNPVCPTCFGERYGSNYRTESASFSHHSMIDLAWGLLKSPFSLVSFMKGGGVGYFRSWGRTWTW